MAGEISSTFGVVPVGQPLQYCIKIRERGHRAVELSFNAALPDRHGLATGPAGVLAEIAGDRDFESPRDQVVADMDNPPIVCRRTEVRRDGFWKGLSLTWMSPLPPFAASRPAKRMVLVLAASLLVTSALVLMPTSATFWKERSVAQLTQVAPV
jgi:hypothetical protein